VYVAFSVFALFILFYFIYDINFHFDFFPLVHVL
jgi:hypothetical protein